MLLQDLVQGPGVHQDQYLGESQLDVGLVQDSRRALRRVLIAFDSLDDFNILRRSTR